MRHDHRPLLKTPTHACVCCCFFFCCGGPHTCTLFLFSAISNSASIHHVCALGSPRAALSPPPVVLAWSINAPHTSDMMVVVLNPWCLWGFELLNYQGCSPLDRGCSWRVQKVFALSSDAAPPIVPFLSSGIHICSWIGRVQKKQKTGLRRVQNRSFSLFQVFFCVFS